MVLIRLNAFGDDGLVLHELLGYRYIEHRQSVGFPESAFLKVKTKLEEERISYVYALTIASPTTTIGNTLLTIPL